MYYASAFWYLVAGLAQYVNLAALLLGLVARTILLLYSAYRLGRAFFPHSPTAAIAAGCAAATTPTLWFGDSGIANYTEQTAFSTAFALLVLAAFLERRATGDFGWGYLAR